MPHESILVTVDGAVSTITLNRPEALNAITRTMLEELGAAVKAAGKDEAIRTIVITGAGRAFSAGVDLKELGDRELKNGSVGDYLDVPARDAISIIQKVPKPVVARVNGFCFTGALEIALACDLIVCAADAQLGDTHAKWGLRPSWGMSARLVSAVGRRRAAELSFTAATFTGEDAARWGLANCAVPLDRLDAAIADIAAQIAANSPGSVAAYKALYNKGGGRSEKKALEYEEEKSFPIADTNERLAAFRK
jgi:enoyl-CoA hydratase